MSSTRIDFSTDVLSHEPLPLRLSQPGRDRAFSPAAVYPFGVLPHRLLGASPQLRGLNPPVIEFGNGEREALLIGPVGIHDIDLSVPIPL